MVGDSQTLPYAKNLFELFALTGGRDGNTWGASARTRATWWNFHYLIFLIINLILTKKIKYLVDAIVSVSLFRSVF